MYFESPGKYFPLVSTQFSALQNIYKTLLSHFVGFLNIFKYNTHNDRRHSNRLPLGRSLENNT